MNITFLLPSTKFIKQVTFTTLFLDVTNVVSPNKLSVFEGLVLKHVMTQSGRSFPDITQLEMDVMELDAMA